MMNVEIVLLAVETGVLYEGKCNTLRGVPAVCLSVTQH